MKMLEKLTQRKKRLKLITQAESAECGLTSLAMIGNYYGHNFDLGFLRQRYPDAGARGMTLKNLIAVASDLQLQSSPFKVSLDGVKTLNVPCVLHWDLNHFVVLGRIQKNGYQIFDPAGSVRVYSPQEFSKHFTGIALELTPFANFVPEEGRVNISLRLLANRVSGLGKACFQVSVISFGLLMLSLIMPYYSIMIMDEGIANRDRSFLMMALYAALTVVVLQALLAFYRNKVLAYLGGLFTFQSHTNIVQHLLNLPLKFYSSRHAGDILSRLGSLDPIRKTLTETLLITLIDGFVAILTFVLLFLYSWQLASLILVSLVLATLVEAYYFRPELEAMATVLEADGKEQANLLETVRGMQSIKLYGIEANRFRSWSKLFAKKMNAEVSGLQLNLKAGALRSYINHLEDIIVLFAGAYLVIHKSISLGVLLAFIAKKEEFIHKYMLLLQNLMAFRMLDVHLERLSDIAMHESENKGVPKALAAGVSLHGKLELRNIKFRYTANDRFLFENLNLVVDPGEFIAIAGPSGSGKTTLAMIMLGLVETHSGEILVDGLPIREVQKVYRQSIATVMQNDCILSGSILENITFFDRKPDIRWAEECAQHACIHEDILRMPSAYQGQISDYNNTISGGQKQRILIARALYRRPKILFMDEATSALDVENEKNINRAIQNLGITRIIIAHRPETLLAAEKIYYLADGELVSETQLGESEDTYPDVKRVGA